MARTVATGTKLGWTIAAWAVALLIFFPILYTIVTSFKSETEAIAGFNLVPSGTLESYREVQSQYNYFKPFMNSVIIAVGSTLLALLVAIPAAWSMAFSPTKRTKDILMWMLSTKMMPAVAVLVPIYLIFRDWGLLDSRVGLTVMLMLINLPIVVWLLYTYFREIPGLHAAPQHHPRLERGVLDDPAHHHERGAPHGVHRLVLQPAGPVLGQAVGRLHAGHSADPGAGLVQPEATGARADLRRRQIVRGVISWAT